MAVVSEYNYNAMPCSICSARDKNVFLQETWWKMNPIGEAFSFGFQVLQILFPSPSAIRWFVPIVLFSGLKQDGIYGKRRLNCKISWCCFKLSAEFIHTKLYLQYAYFIRSFNTIWLHYQMSACTIVKIAKPNWIYNIPHDFTIQNNVVTWIFVYFSVYKVNTVGPSRRCHRL